MGIQAPSRSHGFVSSFQKIMAEQQKAKPSWRPARLWQRTDGPAELLGFLLNGLSSFGPVALSFLRAVALLALSLLTR